MVSFRTQRSIDNSSRVLVILSKNLLKYEDCLRDFSNACGSGKLRVVMRTDERGSPQVTPEDLRDSIVIQRYIEKFSYWREDDKNFYEKLIYFLPHKKVKVTWNEFLSELMTKIKTVSVASSSSSPDSF